jgi:hypothetical protein
MESDAEQRRSSSAFSDLWKIPELPLALLSFAFHFVWEFLQVPAFAGLAARPHWEGIKVCTAATLGDVGLALVAFWMTAGVFRSRQWIVYPRLSQIGLFIAVGIALTVGLEFYYVEVTGRWVYSELMPRVPPLGTGLVPLLQWVVIPLLVASLAGRVIRGS